MISVIKAELRQRMQTLRASMPEPARAAAAERVGRRGVDFIPHPPGAIVSGYFPVRDEFDCRPLLLALAAKGARLALPRIMPRRQLLFLPWQPGDEMALGPLDIPYPAKGEPVLPDVLIVPLLAFDAQGGRLGYGGGYYDRAIASLRREKTVAAIGVGFDEQRLESVPMGERDARLDWVLTPSGAINCRSAG